MSPSHRSLQIIILAALLAGCAVEPTPQATPTPTGAPTATNPSSAPSPTASASPSPTIPSASPTGTPTVTPSPPPSGPGDFVTPIPPGAAAAWTGIRWRKLAATDPLAHIRSVTRWAGGFVAVGDLAVAGAAVRTKVWVSGDGRRWHLLAADVFGPTAMVVGVAATATGVVVLTLQAGIYNENGGRQELEGWTLTGPWQTWTSPDGTSWTGHPGPDFPLPRGMTGDDHPTILAGAGGRLLALTLDGQPLAFSPDGVAWETVSLDAFPGGPAGWRPSDLAALAPGFVAVGSTTTKDVALSSTDGRVWTSHALPGGCEAGGLTIGSAGLIVSFEVGDPHNAKTVWCSSLDGRSWRIVPTLSPIGYWLGAAAQECRGVCPNGILIGNGERMFAYRGYPKQVGWTSSDGRAWKPLTFTGSRPTGMTDPFIYQYTKILTPLGLLFIDSGSGSAWFGQPLT